MSHTTYRVPAALAPSAAGRRKVRNHAMRAETTYQPTAEDWAEYAAWSEARERALTAADEAAWLESLAEIATPEDPRIVERVVRLECEFHELLARLGLYKSWPN